LWNPGFPVAETRVARLRDWHRSFCMSSIHHRGTPENPGLVLALDRATGAHCDGLGFRVEARYAAQTIDYLRERELISSAYLETRLAVTFRDCGTRQEDVLTYVIDPAHEQYRGDLDLEAQARIIADGHGRAGAQRRIPLQHRGAPGRTRTRRCRSRLAGGAGAERCAGG
jgi:cation transport protein ChaC